MGRVAVKTQNQMIEQDEEALSAVTVDTLVAAGMAVLLVGCVAGAVWTAYWWLRFGLAPRPPLSTFQTLVRFLAVAGALLVWWRRRVDLTESSALACAVIAAGSSALFGLGINSVTLQIVRLLFHLLAYCLGQVAIVRWFLKKARSATSVSAAGL